jgi:hypothetical protein
VGFISEKGKATAREVQQSPETGNLLLRWRLGFYGCFNSGVGGGVSHWPWIFLAFLGELVCFAPLLGEGNNLESILIISLVADLRDPVSLL